MRSYSYLLVILGVLFGFAYAGNEFVLPDSFMPKAGSSYTLNWQNLTGSKVSITLVTYFSNGPVTSVDEISQIATNIANHGTTVWQVNNTIEEGQYNLQIEADNNDDTDTYSKQFNLTNSALASSSSAVADPAATGFDSSDSTGSASATANPTITPSGVSTGSSTASGLSSVSGASSTSAATTSSTNNSIGAGAIAGIVVGALVLGAAATLLTLQCLRRRRMGRAGQQQQYQQPYQQYPQYQQYQQSQQPPMGYATPLNPQNLSQHLASQEWAGIKRDVPQKQTAYEDVMQEHHGRDRNRLSQMTELKPSDAIGEPRHEDGMTAVFSEAPRTAIYPASESVWHPGV